MLEKILCLKCNQIVSRGFNINFENDLEKKLISFFSELLLDMYENLQVASTYDTNVEYRI